MGRKKRLLHIFALLNNSRFKIAYILILLGVCTYYLFSGADKFLTLAANANVEMIGLALLVNCLSIMGCVFIPYFIYKGMNVPISYLQVFRIVNFSNLGRYIPGRILVAGNYLLFSHEAGIKGESSGASFIIYKIIIVGMGALCGIPLISLLPGYLKYFIILLPVILILVIHPKGLNWILSLAWQIVRKYKGDEKSNNFQILKNIKYRFFLIAIFISFLYWILTGIIVYLIIYAFQPIGIINIPFCVAAIGLSSTVGFVAFFAPGGIGVRESLGIVLLSQIITPECAFLAMLTTRILEIIIVLCGGLVSAFCILPKSIPTSYVNNERTIKKRAY